MRDFEIPKRAIDELKTLLDEREERAERLIGFRANFGII